MSNMNKQQRDFLYPQLVSRDGEFCRMCTKLKDEVGILEIHHVNGDDSDNRLENLLFLCHGCNHRIPRAQQAVTQRDYTPEHKKNIEKEPLFGKWLYGELMKSNWHYSLDEAIDSGAYVCDVSVESIRRYLRKLTSKAGPYTTKANRYGEMHIWLKGKEPQDTDFF